MQSSEAPEAGGGSAPASDSDASTGSGGQRRGRRRQQSQPSSAPAPVEPRPAEPPVQPEGSGVMLRDAVQVASQSRPGSASQSRDASAHSSSYVSPSKPAPKTLAPGPRRLPARRPALAASNAVDRQLQVEAGLRPSP